MTQLAFLLEGSRTKAGDATRIYWLGQGIEEGVYEEAGIMAVRLIIQLYKYSPGIAVTTSLVCQVSREADFDKTDSLDPQHLRPVLSDHFNWLDCRRGDLEDLHRARRR